MWLNLRNKKSWKHNKDNVEIAEDVGTMKISNETNTIKTARTGGGTNHLQLSPLFVEDHLDYIDRQPHTTVDFYTKLMKYMGGFIKKSCLSEDTIYLLAPIFAITSAMWLL